MPELKLAKLPDRTPVKISISVNPGLYAQLAAYAEIYREAYGETETVPELIPFMLDAFLESDRGFTKARKGGVRDGATRPVQTHRRETPVTMLGTGKEN